MQFRQFLKSACLLLAVSLLAGCSQTGQVENQAYAVIMGVDQTEDGGVEITISLPQISGGGGESEGGGSQSKYLQISVDGSNYESALEELNWAVPRNLNFSQLKAVVFSRELAESADFPDLIKSLVQTERLFTAAYVVVCEEKAKDFVTAMKPVMGSRLSADITAMFDHYSQNGYIPNCTLADLYYRGMSFYSEPMAIYGVRTPGEQKNEEAAAAMALSGDVSELAAQVKSDFQLHYLGAALFSGNRMCGQFDGAQTVLANLLRNEVEKVQYEFNGQSIEFSPIGSCGVDVDTDAEPVKIRIELKLAAVSQQEMPDMSKLKAQFEADVREVISMAQELGIEPFGFAETAVRSFSTIKKWREYNWQEKFRNADVKIAIQFIRSDA